MKLVILGGSFNPVHIGHMVLAEQALDFLEADRCLFIPAAQAPHKPESCAAKAQDRLDMLRAALSTDPRFILDPCEIERGGISYTVDTLADVTARYAPERPPFLIIGDDLVPGFHSWRDPDLVAARCTLVLAHRESSLFPPFAWSHRRLDNLLLPVSSTYVRLCLEKGISCRHLLPNGVMDIIRERGLYGFEDRAR